MIGIIKENRWPHYKGMLFFGDSLLGEISINQYSSSLNVTVENSEHELFDRLKNVLEGDAFQEALESINDPLKQFIMRTNSVLVAESSNYSIRGLADEDAGVMIFGVPTCFQVRIRGFSRTIIIYLDSKIAYYDSSKGLYQIGFNVECIDLIKVLPITTTKEIVKLEFPLKNTLKSKIEVCGKVGRIKVLGFNEEGQIFFKADLRDRNRINEKESFCFLDSENSSNQIVKIFSREDFISAINKEKNEATRNSIKLQKPVVSFCNNLIESLNSYQYKETNGIISNTFEGVKTFRSYKIKNALWDEVIKTNNKKSYAQLKEILENGLALSDSLGNVNVSSIPNLMDYVFSNAFAVKIGRFSAKVPPQEEVKVAFVTEDNFLILEKDEIRKGVTAKELLKQVEESIEETKKRSLSLKMEFQHEYSNQYSYFQTLLKRRAEAVNNIKLSNSSSKVYLDQLESIESQEVRSWWNNSLMGTISSFIKTIKDSGSSIVYEIDTEKIKDAYKKVSSHFEYKYASCDYWIVLRSGSPSHDYFGKGNTDRTRDDWRYNAIDFPITMPESTLENLGIQFKKESPITATRQGYTSCGDFKTVVEPAKQVSRPKMSAEDFARSIKKVLENLAKENYQMAKLALNSRETLRLIDEEIANCSIALGFIEEKLFASNALSSYVYELDQKRQILAKITSDRNELISFSSEIDQEAISIPAIVAFELENSIKYEDLNEIDILIKDEEGQVDIAKTREKIEQLIEKTKDVEKRVVSVNPNLSISFENDLMRINSGSYELCCSVSANVFGNTVKIRLVPCAYENKNLITEISINNFLASKEDLSLMFHLSKNVGKEKMIKDKLMNVLLVDSEKLENLFEENFQANESLRNVYSWTLESILTFFILNNRNFSLDEISLAFRGSSINVSKKYGFVLAGFMSKILEENCHVE